MNNWHNRYLMTSGLVTTIGGAVSFSRSGGDVMILLVVAGAWIEVGRYG